MEQEGVLFKYLASRLDDPMILAYVRLRLCIRDMLAQKGESFGKSDRELCEALARVMGTECRGPLDGDLSQWAKKIAEADSRPYHPADYEKHALKLMQMPKPEESWKRIIANRENTIMHTAFRYSFLDWFEYEMEGQQNHPGALSRRTP